MNGFIRSIKIELTQTLIMNEKIRKYELMMTYHRLSSPVEKERWVKSLKPEDKALVRQELSKTPNKLF